MFKAKMKSRGAAWGNLVLRVSDTLGRFSYLYPTL